MKIEVHLRPEQIEKYKFMEFEEIIADIKTRFDGQKQDIIKCAQWIREECSADVVSKEEKA